MTQRTIVCEWATHGLMAANVTTPKLYVRLTTSVASIDESYFKTLTDCVLSVSRPFNDFSALVPNIQDFSWLWEPCNQQTDIAVITY